MPTGRLAQINVSQGGVPKTAVPAAIVSADGLEGDRVAHPRVHGGPLRAVCLYSLERIRALRVEGNPIAPGALGENLTVEGLAWDRVGPGDRFRLGTVVLEVTSFTTPCSTTAPVVRGNMDRILQKASPGWSRVYAKVLAGGPIRQGMTVQHEPVARA